MSNFKNALNATIEEMIDADNEKTLCCAIYWDDLCDYNAIVMFMEYADVYESIHAVMKDLHTKLSDKLGYSVCVSHNSPIDEDILILGGKCDTEVYYSDECCKKTTIESYKNWVKSDRTNYREGYISIFEGAEAYASMCNIKAEAVLNRLNWDKDPQAQIIRLLTDAYWFTQA